MRTENSDGTVEGQSRRCGVVERVFYRSPNEFPMMSRWISLVPP